MRFLIYSNLNISVSFYFIILHILQCFGKTNEESINFFVIGDWGGQPDQPYDTDIELSISKQMVKSSKDVKINFLLALGDNFYYSGVENEYDSRFKNTFELVFNDKELYFPWYIIAGNHDWRGNVSAQIAYSNHSSRWNYPNYFYTIEKSLPNDPQTKIAIIMIDTVLLCGRTYSDFMTVDTFESVMDSSTVSNLWKFIENELIKYEKYPYVIVAGHYPIWSVSHHGPTRCLVKRLDIMLQKYNASAYINGHDHTLEHIQVPYGSKQVMNYFTIGAANFFDNSKKHENSIPKNSLKFHWFDSNRAGGLALMKMTKDSLQVKLLTTDDKEVYVTKIKPRF